MSEFKFKISLTVHSEVEMRKIFRGNFRVYEAVLYLIMISFLTIGCQSSPPKANLKEITGPDVSLPLWSSDNCSIADEKYHFVGFGEGKNAVEAIANALIDSRYNALACVLGGVLTSTLKLEESLTDTKMTSQREFSLNSGNVNWDGYTQVSSRTFFANRSLTKVYVQYSWPISKIEREKTRLSNLNAQIENTKALANEVKLKERLIDEQQKRINELADQEERLKNIRNVADRAVAKMKAISKNQISEGAEVKKIMSTIKCGLTVGQLIESYKDPDRLIIEKSQYFVSDVKLHWDPYVVSISFSQLKAFLGTSISNTASEAEILRAIAPMPIRTIYDNFGLYGRQFSVCNDT